MRVCMGFLFGRGWVWLGLGIFNLGECTGVEGMLYLVQCGWLKRAWWWRRNYLRKATVNFAERKWMRENKSVRKKKILAINDKVLYTDTLQNFIFHVTLKTFEKILSYTLFSLKKTLCVSNDKTWKGSPIYVHCTRWAFTNLANIIPRIHKKLHLKANGGGRRDKRGGVPIHKDAKKIQPYARGCVPFKMARSGVQLNK